MGFLTLLTFNKIKLRIASRKKTTLNKCIGLVYYKLYKTISKLLNYLRKKFNLFTNQLFNDKAG